MMNFYEYKNILHPNKGIYGVLIKNNILLACKCSYHDSEAYKYIALPSPS